MNTHQLASVLAFSAVLAGARASAQYELRTLQGTAPQGYFGAAVVGLGDIDGDGFDDQAVTSRGVDPPMVQIFSGRDGALLREHFGTPGADDAYGWAGANSGDVDGDGLDDLIVSAPDLNKSFTGQGQVYVYSGADGALLHTFTAPAATGAQFGYSVAGAGDVDMDGYDDVIVGAPGDTVYAQYWFRDPASPSTTGLSDGLRYDLCPRPLATHTKG